MEIEEVSEMLNSFGLLGRFAPEHIFIVDEEIHEKMNKNKRYRGLAPVEKRSVMVLSEDADFTTTPHEWLHAMTPAGEVLAYPFGKIMAIRYEAQKNFPILKRERPIRVKYRKDTVPERFRGRAEHYILDDSE